MHAKSLQSCLTLCNPMDCSLPGSSVRGIFQAGVLEWVAIPFSRGIFPTQGLNPNLQHWRADSLPLSHQGSSLYLIIKFVFLIVSFCLVHLDIFILAFMNHFV